VGGRVFRTYSEKDGGSSARYLKFACE